MKSSERMFLPRERSTRFARLTKMCATWDLLVVTIMMMMATMI